MRGVYKIYLSCIQILHHAVDDTSVILESGNCHRALTLFFKGNKQDIPGTCLGYHIRREYITIETVKISIIYFKYIFGR